MTRFEKICQLIEERDEVVTGASPDREDRIHAIDWEILTVTLAAGFEAITAEPKTHKNRRRALYAAWAPAVLIFAACALFNPPWLGDNVETLTGRVALSAFVGLGIEAALVFAWVWCAAVVTYLQGDEENWAKVEFLDWRVQTGMLLAACVGILYNL